MAGVLKSWRHWTGSMLLVVVHDAAASAVALFSSLWFAFGQGLAWTGPSDPQVYLLWSSAFVLVSVPIFALNGLHRGVWRFTSFRELQIIVESAGLAVLLFLPIVFVTSRAAEFPRSSVFLLFIFLTGLLAGPRVLARALLERHSGRLPLSGGPRVPVYLVGIGSRAESFVRDCQRDAHSPYEVRGLLAPSAYWLNRDVQGVPVVSTIDGLPELLDRQDALGAPVQRLVLADESLSQFTKDQILALASERGISLGRLPAATEIRDTNGSAGDVKPIALEDLLHRPQKRLDRRGMRSLIEGRRVLITGAGGSIGSELVRQVLSFQPAHVTLVDNCEFNLYAIDQEVSQMAGSVSRSAVLCDVRERRRVAHAFDKERPDIVFHAAAYKHVPLVEQNPLEGIRTNVVGTRNVVDECVRHGVSAMVMISTDKAVNPTNVMGATKRLAEAYAQSLDLEGVDTRFVTVRFGNVLGSTGSVVPLFQKQIAAGGPVTVTHPDITRYFMTIPEAVQLVLQAFVCGSESDEYRGKLFVLDMGEPVKIADLARQMIRLAGKRPDQDVEIKYVGLRPGEKLHEELLHAREKLVKSPHDGLLLAAPRSGIRQMLAHEIDALETAVDDANEDTALRILRRVIPEFSCGREPAIMPPRERRLTLVRSS